MVRIVRVMVMVMAMAAMTTPDGVFPLEHVDVRPLVLSSSYLQSVSSVSCCFIYFVLYYFTLLLRLFKKRGEGKLA